ncbi:MAG: hypothetical protein LBQ21_07040 [Clostridiales Family XIII bacterium]|jgi:hypothetical protein|nr:hypothetical protein [Clostridiales Family XIII bacterium]
MEKKKIREQNAKRKARKNAAKSACRKFRFGLAGVLIFLMWLVQILDKRDRKK